MRYLLLLFAELFLYATAFDGFGAVCQYALHLFVAVANSRIKSGGQPR
jgi:hypothetical protein